MKIVSISDTHMFHDKLDLPVGDVIVHAGDATMRGKESEIHKFFKWYGSLPHGHKIYCPGNHDFFCQNHTDKAIEIAEERGVILLIDKGVAIDGIKFYGSPWQPWYHDWAFNFPKLVGLQAAKKKWAEIPDDTDILITHGPPHKIRDKVFGKSEHVGCPELRNRIAELNLKYHIFGHIHEQYGTEVSIIGDKEVHFINASIWNHLGMRYPELNHAICFEVDSK